MTAKNSKTYLGYLNKSVDEQKKSYHCAISNKSIHADFFSVSEKVQTNPKTREFRSTKDGNILSKGYTNNWSRELFVIDYVLKIDP